VELEQVGCSIFVYHGAGALLDLPPNTLSMIISRLLFFRGRSSSIVSDGLLLPVGNSGMTATAAADHHNGLSSSSDMVWLSRSWLLIPLELEP
jgi:hypothetical protein